MYQIIKGLLDNGVSKSCILYLNLDDDRLLPLKGDELSLLPDTFRELNIKSDDDKYYFFLDEIQNISGWEKWIKGIYDRKKDIKFIISGSNASVLSEDVSSRLTGRHLTTRMFPFSFNEFLECRKFSFEVESLPYSEKKIEVKRFFREYMTKGGFPEVVMFPALDHIRLLQTYFDDIIHRDIVSRHGVRNPSVFKDLALFCISNIAKPHTYNSLRRLFSGYSSLSTDAVINYISYLEDAFLLFSVSHYDASLKKQINKPKKLYCIDPGMINAVSFSFSENLGRLYENIVFVQLLRSGHEIYYWQDKKGLEVDFVLRSGLSPVRLIQVSTDISDPDTKNREVNGMISAMENFGIDEGTVITSDNFGTETVSGRIIHYVPLWYWLLLEDSEGASTL
jgi:predicted AAA+ superfamily ATPase